MFHYLPLMAFGANEQFQELTGVGPGPLVFPESIQPKVFAAGSGTIKKCQIVVYNRTTGFWQVYNNADELGTSTVYTLTTAAALTAGSYTLTIDGETTGAIQYNDVAATIRAAILALGNIDAADIGTIAFSAGTSFTQAGGTGFTLTLQGKYKGTAITVTITPTGITGSTIVLTNTVVGAAGFNGLGLAGTPTKPINWGVVWPEDVVLAAANEVMGNVMMGGKIDRSAIVPNGSDTISQLDTFLSAYSRNSEIVIEGATY